MTRNLHVLLLALALVLAACGGSNPSPAATRSPEATTSARLQPTPTEEPAPSIGPTGSPTETGPEPDATSAPRATAEPTRAAPEGTATTAAQPTTPRAGQDARFDVIAAEASKLRGLPIRSEVREDYLTREQLRRRLEKDLAEEYKPGEVEADERVLKAFGLAPENLDLRKLYVDLYSGAIAGLYDPETRRMYVVTEGRTLNALGELTYAHEVTHALQDQHYDLEKLSDRAEKVNDDAALAAQSLVEGDATVLSYRDYLLANPELRAELLQAIQEEQQNAQLPENVPPIIQETLTFPYEQGAFFVTTLRGGGSSWEAVDKAYRDPPTSTEQILHPDKYLQRDEPTDIQVPDLAPALGAGWKKLEENIFGEFQTRILLDGQLDEGDATDAAEGWDGDQFVLYTKGEQDVVAWQTAWDSEAEATEFAGALRDHDEARFGGEFRGQGGTNTLAAKGRFAVVRQVGTRVHYVLAPTPDLATRAMGLLAR